MSAAILDDYTSSSRKQTQFDALAERTRILETVSRKAQNKTLTLQETTDLYTEFNQTYLKKRNQHVQKDVDESWALKLLEEAEQEELQSSEQQALLKTRVNGIPMHRSEQETFAEPLSDSAITLQKSTFSANEALDSELNNLLDTRPQTALRDKHLKNLELGSHHELDNDYPKRSHRALAAVVGLAGITTLSAVMSFAFWV